MSVVWSCNEWDQLEEVIVGNPLRACFPTADPTTRLAQFPGRSLEEIPQGPFPQQIIEETEEDLTAFVAVLEELGITIKRPQTWPHEEKFSTIHWESEGYYNYCPHDIMLVIGDHIIETPNVIRSRSQETFSYRTMLIDYLKSGAKWYSAPRPMLLDSLFEVDPARPTPRNDEPAFDAANILRPGLMLCNPARINDDTLPEILKQWKIIYSPPMENTGRHDADYLARSIGSKWIDMNALSIGPNLVVVDKYQTPLIKLLEKQGLDVTPLELRHSKMLGGGFHCITLDIRRTGTLQRYFD